MPAAPYPKRLIEVDLPIKKISEHARREKSIRHGHISTLHIWWARRPLAACRAVICAALWPDPADPCCPDRFRSEATKIMDGFWNPTGTTPRNLHDPFELQKALLDFIAEFSNWENSTTERYLKVARNLTQVSHEVLGGEPGTHPLVVDPFAGGGAIPLEALRVGADAYASDLNPVAVLLNKVVLEYIPKYGKDLADEVKKSGKLINNEVETKLAEFYPKDPDGATPIAYLWARTIRCDETLGGCGIEIPLIRSLWLAKRRSRPVALRLKADKEKKRVDFEIIENPKLVDVKNGTVKGGSATCPVCGHTTPVASVRSQLQDRHGGTNDARMFCIVTTRPGQQGRFYRVPTQRDYEVVRKANDELTRLELEWKGDLSLVPDESTAQYDSFVNRGPIYGMTKWRDFFLSRQLLVLTTLIQLITKIDDNFPKNTEKGLMIAVKTILACAIDRQAEHLSSLCRWNSTSEKMQGTFGRQAFPMVWDFCEANPFGGSVGSWNTMIELVTIPFETVSVISLMGHATMASATLNSLPTDSVNCLFTDPPYYFSVQYADLSDFCYIWLNRSIGRFYPDLFKEKLSPKSEEIIVQSPGHEFASQGKNREFYESHMRQAMLEGRRILAPNGLGVFIFANTSTSGWETFLQSLIEAGWVITGSWSIDTEMATRVLAQKHSVLASSIHLVCRPRENPDGSICEEIGDWQDVLTELPKRIHEWMPRLKREDVVGADAIFACLGPALEIFSRYSRVEKASGEFVKLHEYLEKVWEAVEREALGMIFEGADAAGFEEDARLTAMWLWTLKTEGNGAKVEEKEAEENEGEEEVETEEEAAGMKKAVKGYALEYDAARKIAQGLGVHLEGMPSIVEVKKGKARLLPVSERAQHLLKREEGAKQRRTRGRGRQLTLFPGEASTEDEGGAEPGVEVAHVGETTLNRIHQAMLLFGAGKGDALRRFLVEEGIGQEPQFWKLAQALVALYPTGSEEKRWVEGVLARKKGLGL